MPLSRQWARLLLLGALLAAIGLAGAAVGAGADGWTQVGDGTLIKVKQGVVAVQDVKLKNLIIVRAGHSYLAKGR